ncbi:hypothetical protein [Paenibacillus lutrae]|uniref:Uncharacterized protein n=1 Tax=Paenibacillus lutrae TaxID=2078573 RepID=A0A7X3FJ46_9BACL|nr:hypothetical protein [Paenibacillus lutrae]MVP00522.1 hypothetical protein [Paenibacillus lutrae]
MTHSYNNVVLFPKTSAAYEKQMTLMLEQENYEEAARLLRYLLQFSRDDSDKQAQWRALLQWLETMFPETIFEDGLKADDEDLELTEEDLMRQSVSDKSAEGRQYVGRLLDMLEDRQDMERQMIALEQLAYADDPRIDEFLKEWLHTAENHPFIQFRALQVLKQREVKGPAVLARKGDKMVIRIEDTPLKLEEFPEKIREMLYRVQQLSENDQPDFGFFAEQTWLEFLKTVYGTEVYAAMSASTEEEVDAWACALHGVLLQTLYGEAGREELLEQYGITAGTVGKWTEAYGCLHSFMRTFFTGS